MYWSAAPPQAAMFFSGIADEAASDLQGQIRAHQALGWRHIEIRGIDGVNLTSLGDEQFQKAAAALEASGLRVSCFASQLANWARPIDSSFDADRSELERAIPRMQRLKTPFIRCMSYPNSTPPLADREWRREAVERLRVLARMAEDGGVVLVHENCSGWGGQGPEQTLALLEEVGSPSLKLVFDTGNPIAYGQDAWEYYLGVRDHVVYVHIKDYLPPEKDAQGKSREVACFPGEGLGRVREIVADLLGRGYDGGFSIEPHITSVIHLQQAASDPELAFETYIEYGRRLEALVREVQASGGRRQGA
jgi:L-ribulose-5-phosphate 3-epimerase